MKKSKIIIQCNICQKDFFIHLYRIKNSKTNMFCCSMDCLTESKKHKKFTDEHRLKISKALKGKPFSGVKCDWVGRKHKPESRVKMSHKRIGYKMPEEQKLNMSGVNNRFWKGGISVGQNRKKYKSFKANERRVRLKNAEGNFSFKEWEDLKNKYNNMCLCCKKYEPEIKLTVDHIIPLSRGGTNYIDNVQPLCKKCNSMKHVTVINYLEIMELS